MISELIAFAAGAALVWYIRRPKDSAAQLAAEASAADTANATDPMRAPDLDLDAAIIEYIGENEVFHINDICHAIEHPKGARFVRAHVHMLLEQGKIRYRNMVYTI